jgi:hypothetical protein
MDAVGHVVTVQTPFEGAKEAAFLPSLNQNPCKAVLRPVTAWS